MSDNTDASVIQGNGSSHASATIQDKTKNWVIGALSAMLGAAVVAMIFMGVEWRQAATESRLNQYNLDWFRTHEFSDLNAKVLVQDRMILALQVGQTCKKEH